MKYNSFVKYFISIITVIFLFVAFINFIVDPLWMFSATSNIDIKQKDFNERVQKTNYLAYKENNFDAVLLGNSRTTYINQNDFELDSKVFNYSVNAMSVDEYLVVIDNFVKLTYKEPEIILIGVDILSIGYNKEDILTSALLNTKDNMYRFSSLFSIDNFIFSCKNLITTLKLYLNKHDRKQRYYNKNMEKGSSKANLYFDNKKFINDSKGLKLNFTNKVFDIEIFKKIKTKYKNSKIIIFTLPIHSILFNEWSKDKDFVLFYLNWMKSLVEVFGEVNHFLYNTEVSYSNYDFFDAYHFYPNIGKKIAQNVSNPNLMQEQNNTFGTIINKENIKEYINTTKKEMLNAL